MIGNKTIPTILIAVLIAGTAAAPARAGILDRIAGKVERKLREKAAAEKAEIEQKIEQGIGRPEAEVEETVGGVVDQAEGVGEQTVGGIIGSVESAVDGSLGSSDGTIDAAIDGVTGPAGYAVEAVKDGATGAGSEPARATHQGSGTNGAFFEPPPGVSSRADLYALLQARSRSSAGRDYVLHLRRTAQDAYYEFWSYWFGHQDELRTYLDIMRTQRAQLLEFGATKEAQALDVRIAALEEELREFVAAPLWQHVGRTSPNPLITFGLDIETGPLPLDQIMLALDGLVSTLGMVTMSATSDDAKRRITDLARDVTTIRADLASGDLASAQGVMDRRWEWVMTD